MGFFQRLQFIRKEYGKWKKVKEQALAEYYDEMKKSTSKVILGRTEVMGVPYITEDVDYIRIPEKERKKIIKKLKKKYPEIPSYIYPEEIETWGENMADIWEGFYDIGAKGGGWFGEEAFEIWRKTGTGWHLCGEGVLSFGLGLREIGLEQKSDRAIWGILGNLEGCRSGNNRGGGCEGEAGQTKKRRIGSSAAFEGSVQITSDFHLTLLLTLWLYRIGKNTRL